MKPTNRFEREVEVLSGKLAPITEAQKKYATEHCFEKMAFWRGYGCWCTHCGGEFRQETSTCRIPELEPERNHDTGKKVRCPHCGEELDLWISGRRSYEASTYYTVMTTMKGVQVMRHYVVGKQLKKGGEATHVYNEVAQVWINEEGKIAVMARPINGMSYYSDRWIFYKPMSIKKYDRRGVYNIDPIAVYGRMKVLPIFKRNGFDGTLPASPQNTLLGLLDKDNETLYKSKQYELFRYNLYSGFYRDWKHAVNICNRNNYIVEDASLWADYLRLLEEFGKDTHNAHYVCPKDLHGEHQKLLRIHQKIEAARREKERIERDKIREKEYKKAKKKYFGLCFGDERIVVTVLQSVKEFYEEGEEMHHCVYSNRYYEKKDALILSARTPEGKRIETIEVDLKAYEIVQSRGKNNSKTAQHQDIVNLVKQNMNLIKQCNNGRNIRTN